MKEIHIDFRAGSPVYLQLVQQIQQQVAAAELKPGDQLPTVRQLAAELRVNFNTIARSYRILDEAGLISTQQGRGTYILEAPPPEVAAELKQRSMSELTRNYIDEAQRLGFSDQEIQNIISLELSNHKGAE